MLQINPSDPENAWARELARELFSARAMLDNKVGTWTDDELTSVFKMVLRETANHDAGMATLLLELNELAITALALIAQLQGSPMQSSLRYLLEVDRLMEAEGYKDDNGS